MKNLTNIALAELGAIVIQQSSCSNSQISNSSNILIPQQDKIWNSGQGLPQYVIISLQEVDVRYSQLSMIGFHCWHDYPTNPKIIDVEVAQHAKEQFIHWAELELKNQRGKQFFKIQPIPESYRFIKIVITEAFGDFETYLNQIFLMAETVDSKEGSQFDVDDLEPSLQEHNEQINRSASNSRAKELKYSNVQKKLSNRQNRQYLKMQTQEAEASASYEQFQDNTFLNRQKYSTGGSRAKNHQSSIQSKHSGQEVESNDQSYSKNMALLTLSKNYLQMEENVQEIRRNLHVLDMKINVSYQNLQKNIMKSVERMVDSKMQQFREEFKRQSNGQKYQQKKGKDKRQSQKSKEYQEVEQVYEEKELNSHKSSSNRQRKKELKLVNPHQFQQKKGQQTETIQKQQLVNSLIGKLAQKLKQRELKLKKIQSKRQQIQQTQKYYGQHRKY